MGTVLFFSPKKRTVPIYAFTPLFKKYFSEYVSFIQVKKEIKNG